MVDDPQDPQDLAEVQRRLQEIQRRKRPRIRWSITRHTAELAIGALESAQAKPRRSGKPHRRQRRKRLL
jgi:hypothetical protein